MTGPKTGTVAGSAIPANHRKLIESLKEIVQSSDEEIYAMLKECNMDLNETAQKLLSEDTFHIVRRKREKRKENANNRELPESKGKGGSTIFRSQPGCVSELGAGRRSSLPDFNMTEPGGGRGNPLLPARENGGILNKKPPIPLPNKSRVPKFGEHIGNATSGINADLSLVGSNAESSPATLNGNLPPAKPSSGLQGAWCVGTRLADVLKNGTHSSARLSTPTATSHPLQTPSSSGPDVESGPSAAKSSGCPAVDVDSQEPANLVNTEAQTLSDGNIVPTLFQHLQISEESNSGSNIEKDLKVSQQESSSLDSILQDQAEGIENSIMASHAGNLVRLRETSGITNAPASWTSMAGDTCYETQDMFPHQQKDTVPPFPSLNFQDTVRTETRWMQDLNSQNERPVIIPDHLRVSGADYTGLSFGSFDTIPPVSLSSGDSYGVTIQGGENISTPETGNTDQSVSSSFLTEYGSSTRHESASPMYLERLVPINNVATTCASTLFADRPDPAGQQSPEHIYARVVPSHLSIGAPSELHSNQYALEQLQIRAHDLSNPSRGLHSYPVPPASTYDAIYRSGLGGDVHNATSFSSGVNLKSNSGLSSFTGQRCFEDIVNAIPFSASSSFGPMPAGNSQQLAATASQQSLPIHAQHLGSFDNGFGYQYLPQNRTYIHSLYHQNTAGSNSYQFPTGSSFSPSVGSAAKYPVPQLNFAGNGDPGLPSASVSNMVYSNYAASESATYAVNDPATGENTIVYNDMVSRQRRDNGAYVPTSQLEASGMSSTQTLFPRERTGIQTNTFSNMARQNQNNAQSISLQQIQPHSYQASAYSGLHHFQESAPSQSVSQLMQQQRVFGVGSAFRTQNGSHEQPQHIKQTWPNF